jgi:hypothetical protein
LIATMPAACACGTDRVSNCNAPAIPKAQRAIEALKANPEKSNRAIAAEIGASDILGAS